MKIKNILLPYDGSFHSINAAKFALDLARLYEAHVTILYCYEEEGTSPKMLPPNLISAINENNRAEAKKILNGGIGVFENQGVDYSTELIKGSPGKVLTNLAKSDNYDLIIMGSHGHSDIAGLFLGSVTHKVLNKIYCPVMIVP